MQTSTGITIQTSFKTNAQFNSTNSVARSENDHDRKQVITSDKRRGTIFREIDVKRAMIFRTLKQ